MSASKRRKDPSRVLKLLGWRHGLAVFVMRAPGGSSTLTARGEVGRSKPNKPSVVWLAQAVFGLIAAGACYFSTLMEGSSSTITVHFIFGEPVKRFFASASPPPPRSA